VWPAYSPDGTQIAYNVGGGGIFIIGATGENPHRLTTFGANPAWSPDGRRIVFGSEQVVSAYSTTNTGTLWTVATSGGAPEQVDSLAHGDAYQPEWSPSGGRIAFWTSTNGRRDLVTIPAGGGERVKVTDDVALDWAPSWSPDGKYLYFASDRGGAMGIWRIRLEEASGRPAGEPEPVASGVDVAMDLPHMSKDGATLVFRAEIESVNPAAIAFDPTTGRAGAVTLLQNRTGILAPSDVSPDGQWIALSSVPNRRQDVFIMRPDGSSLTRLTDDPGRDWYPRFTADGEALTFFSNQSGRYEAWSIRLDGSDRTRITDFPNGVYFLIPAPDDKRVVVQPLRSGAVIGGPPWPLTEQRATPLTGLDVADGMFEPSYWSPDGRWLSGRILLPSGEVRGNAVYDITAHRARQLSDDARAYGYDLAWLPGSQRVVYFTKSGTLVMQDIASLARQEIGVSLPYPPDQMGSITASPDGRTLYYGARQTEANIWMVKQSAVTRR
jgi:Tol biopolymer transport system component